MQLPRLITFYLPQFHPTQENDDWWGEGFTEWTNVVKARPLFRGHYQPHFPADLGYYDLRVPEVRNLQADLARSHGIYGFCYYHYWFSGKRLLERPFAEVCKSGGPDFPFCLCWANQSWTGIWHGEPNRILIEQEYPGIKDFEDHFNYLRKSFLDPRYILVDDKPLFVIYKPLDIPDSNQYIELWQRLAKESGIKGIFFLGIGTPDWDYKKAGFDGMIIDDVNIAFQEMFTNRSHFLNRLILNLFKKNLELSFMRIIKKPMKRQYKEFVNVALNSYELKPFQFNQILPNWDNTPRCGMNGIVLENSTPELFKMHLMNSIEKAKSNNPDNQFIFIKSWNEWAEGNYLEPDQKYGLKYLNIIKDLFLQN